MRRKLWPKAPAKEGALGTLGIFAILFYVFTMRVVIYDIPSMAIITTPPIIVNFTTQCGENLHTDIANFATLIHQKKN